MQKCIYAKMPLDPPLRTGDVTYYVMHKPLPCVTSTCRSHFNEIHLRQFIFIVFRHLGAQVDHYRTVWAIYSLLLFTRALGLVILLYFYYGMMSVPTVKKKLNRTTHHRQCCRDISRLNVYIAKGDISRLIFSHIAK